MGKVKEQMMEAQEKDIHNKFNPDSAFLESQSQCDNQAEAFFTCPFSELIIDTQHLQIDVDILFKSHDCHLSPEDGCKACETLTNINSHISSIKKLINDL